MASCIKVCGYLLGLTACTDILLSLAPREWVANCLGKMTDSNKDEAQKELRKVISDAYGSKTLWTTDWAGVELHRCRIIASLGLLLITTYTLTTKSSPQTAAYC